MNQLIEGQYFTVAAANNPNHMGFLYSELELKYGNWIKKIRTLFK